MGTKVGYNIATTGLIFATDPNSELSWDGTNLTNLIDSSETTTASGTVSFSTDGGGTFTFGVNGSNFNFGNSGSLWGLNDVTLMGWVKQPSTSNPHQTVICTSSSYRYGLKLMSRYHGEVAAWIGDGGSNSYLLGSGVNIDGDNKYHHIACTRNAGTGKLEIWVDGSRENYATTYTGTINDDGSTGYGFDYHSIGYYHVGNIGQVYGYNRVLIEDEIQQAYEREKERYGL